MFRAFLLILVLTIGLAATGQCQTFYHAFRWNADGSYVDLGTLQGGTDSWAYAINNAGQATGWSANGAGELRAVRWETDGSITDLGPGIGYGINSLGQVVGQSDGRAILWDLDGSVLDLGQGVAEDINDCGQVAGSLVVQVGSVFESRGFVWSTSTGLRSLGKLPGTIGSRATGINNLGQVAGLSLVNNDYWQAAVWDVDAGWTVLCDGSALAINDAGQVAGNSIVGNGFLWASDTGCVGLPSIRVGGLNAAGQVAGFFYPGDYDHPHAAIWQDGSPLQDLGVPTGYLWSKARGIDDQGRAVGAAMSVPEPTTCAALILGLGGLIPRGRFSRRRSRHNRRPQP